MERWGGMQTDGIHTAFKQAVAVPLTRAIWPLGRMKPPCPDTLRPPMLAMGTLAEGKEAFCI